jgi:MAF protein
MVTSAQVDESVHFGEHPEAYVRRLAGAKAQAVQSLLGSSLPAETLIIGADTAVVDASEILGKPSNIQEADSMLRRLRGRTHQVFTGLAVIRLGDDSMLSDVCITDVPMRNYADAEMQAYIGSGDPMDKAGAYAIQHANFHPVENLRGCYANVMGLPVCHLTRMMERFGVHPGGDPARACQEALDYPCPIFRQVLSQQGDSIR